MIYFISSSDGLRVKIGTTIRLSQRLKQLRSQYADGLKVVAVTEGSFCEESALHNQFKLYSAGGEWFWFEAEIRDFIRDHADTWDGTDEVPCNDVSVKMDDHVVKRARIAAAFKEMSLAEYLSETVRVAAERDIAAGYPEGPPKKKGAKGD